MNSSKIKSIKKIGRSGKRYDITLSKNHNFFANGILVHNSSGTFYIKDGEFGVCSRNLELKRDENNAFWKLALKYDLENKLKSLNKNIAIQAEACGPSINGGHTAIRENDLYVFDAYDIDNRKYFGFQELAILQKNLGFTMVPVLEADTDFKYDIPALESFANKEYDKGYPIEGIVVRPLEPMLSDTMQGRLSFKVLNKEFLIKYKE